MIKKGGDNMKRQILLAMVGLVVIGLLTWTTPTASADTSGVWKLTGSMATSRWYSAIGRLSDGRIIVVGGTNYTGVDGAASNFYETAEIYDPATSTWTATGSLTTGGRALHTLTMLWGGRTLITGGYNGSAVLSSAEIYDLNTGTFSATGSMKKVRAQHSAINLFDGRVLITGGVIDPSGTPSNTAEIYDPATGTFSETGADMAEARYAHRMTSVGDGKVLITGGFGAGGAELATTELFDPATGTFSPTGSLAYARANHSATELPTGEILVAGGYGGGGVLGSTEIYNPDSKTFRAGPTLNQARQVHSAWPLPNGLVLISGGNNNASGFWDIQTSFLSSAELYNPAINTFTTTGSKNNATSGGNSYLLWTGKLLAAGGGTNEAELYTPEMPGTLETWVAAANMHTARANTNYFYLDDGRVLMVGGLNSSGNPLASAELYDYLTGNFSSTGSMSTPRQHHYGVGLYTGKILVTGGRPSASANVLNSAELYNPVSGTFTSTGDMLRYRRLHKATPLPNGKVLITGGLGGTSNTANLVLTTAELYDPATGTFTQTAGGLNTARYNHQAYLLYTGKVLIAGGVGTGSVVLNSAELYDPATNRFTAAGNMITARNNPLVTALPNGKILVSSGVDAVTGGTPIQAVEIYDPATGTFTAADDALVARYYDRVVRLDNGKTIFVGGHTTADTSSVTNTAELYNHVSGKFSPTGSLITGRRNFAQWSLPNGRILVAGGYDASGTMLSSAELYTPLIADVFPDVPINYWAYDYIMAIYNAGITTGCAQDDPGTPENERRYCPENNVTREEMAAFIVRAVVGEPPLNYCDSGSLFPDVTPDMWSCKYIKRLKELEITTGYNDGRYGPYDQVPREQMATFLVRAVEGEPPTNYCDSGSLFPDVTPDMWSCRYIKRLKELTITTGYGDGRYGPYDFVTRAQMAAFLSRAFLGME
jgi:WD40 repeat protein